MVLAPTFAEHVRIFERLGAHMFVLSVLAFCLIFAFFGYNMALTRGKNAVLWSIICFFTTFIGLMFLALSTDGQRGVAKRADLIDDARWNSLVQYDPDIKKAIERLSPLGPSAIFVFKSAYSHVQNKESIPLIIQDIEKKASADDKNSGRGLYVLEEVYQGVDILKDINGVYVVNDMRTSDLNTARTIARVYLKNK